MKTIGLLIAISFTMLLHQNVYSQLGNIKNRAKSSVTKKVKEKKNKETSSSTTTPTTSSKGKSDTPKYDPDSPVYKAYSAAKQNLKFAKSTTEGIEWRSNIEGSNETLIKDLAKVKTNLTFLKEQGEDSKNYYEEFSAEYQRLEDFRVSEMENYTIDEAYEKKMEAYYYWAKLQRPIKDSTIRGTYTSYKKFNADFETNRPKKYASSLIQKYSKAVDNYLAVEVYEDIPYFRKKVDAIVRNIHKPNASGDKDYLLNAKSYKRDCDEIFEEIKYYDNCLFEKKDEINSIKADLSNEVAMLDEYVSSGKYDAHVAKYKQELIDAVRLRPVAMNSSKYLSMIKKGVEKGTVSKANVVSDRWLISRNEWGIPKYKYLPIDIAVTYNGKCYLAYGQIVKDYAGGGTYGADYFSDWGLQDEMNCGNVSK